MATTSAFRNGFVFNHKGGLWKVVEFLHVKPGKGPDFVRTKIKNIRSPVMVMHGDQDETIPHDMGRQLFDAANEPKRF